MLLINNNKINVKGAHKPYLLIRNIHYIYRPLNSYTLNEKGKSKAIVVRG